MRVPTAGPTATVGEIRKSLAGDDFDSAADIAVLDRGALVGIVPMEALLAADPEARVSTLADTSPPSVAPDANQEIAASLMAERGRGSLAVVDADGGFVGLIPPKRMLGVLLEEHLEDLARLGGFLAGAGRARRAAEEPVMRRLYHRLPWLLVGLVGAMASAVLVGSFEEELDAKVILAFFVPAVVYMADAVGTQTEAILIRGLSVGVAVRDVLLREVVTGAITGVVVGALFLPFVIVGYGDAAVAAAVALALFASCSISTLVAIALPSLFQRLGADPAFGSGPLATVIQDLLSIAVYLAIAIPLAT